MFGLIGCRPSTHPTPPHPQTPPYPNHPNHPHHPHHPHHPDHRRKVTSSIKLSKFSAVFINNFLCCIMLTMTATATGELQRALEAVVGSERSLDYRYLVLNGFTGVIAFLMNFASLWCIACTSGTTYSIIGSLNKVRDPLSYPLSYPYVIR